MTLAFYAPMKPPDHPVPSGDRTIARALIAALEHSGEHVELASRLRVRDGKGDAQAQQDLTKAAEAEVNRVIPVGRAAGWRAWITYHNYYKAPDLIGPAVSRELNIPYVQIESTRARKRLQGPWARFAKAAEYATDAADLVFYFSGRDAIALKRDAPQGQALVHLRPFLPRATLPPASTLDGPMLSVGMMRAGDKLASYRIIADTLALLRAADWRLHIAGDGPERVEVEALMARFGARVTFLGELDAHALAQEYAHASLMFWPGVNEALGQVYLEAQAAGVPVVAQDRPGMRDVLVQGVHPDPKLGHRALADNIDGLLARKAVRTAAADVARGHVAQFHLMGMAKRTLSDGLALVGVRP
jgi:glycosyltransferase involved in cell wall biosynthesis